MSGGSNISSESSVSSVSGLCGDPTNIPDGICSYIFLHTEPTLTSFPLYVHKLIYNFFFVEPTLFPLFVNLENEQVKARFQKVKGSKMTSSNCTINNSVGEASNPHN